MNLRRLTLALTLALAVSACSTLKTSHDFDPSADFSGYSEFGYVEIAPNPELDDLTEQRLQNAIDLALNKKGMRHVDDVAQADFAVGYQVVLDEEVTYNTVNTGYGGGWGYGGWYGPGYRGGMGISSSRTYENRVQVGTLVLDIFDVESKQLVWRGTASSDIQEVNDPRERQERLNKALEKLLKDFPPSTN